MRSRLLLSERCCQQLDMLTGHFMKNPGASDKWRSSDLLWRKSNLDSSSGVFNEFETGQQNFFGVNENPQQENVRVQNQKLA